MGDDLYCLDSGVLITFLTNEKPAELRDAATSLMLRAIASGKIVVPSFAWAEVGSVLRKKLRRSDLTEEEAEVIWSQFNRLPIDYINIAELRLRAWEIAEQYGLATLYDAAFLACAEVAPGNDSDKRQFWTADDTLI